MKIMYKFALAMLATTAFTSFSYTATAEPYHHGVAGSRAAPSVFGRMAPDFAGRLNRMFPIGDSEMRVVDQDGDPILDGNGKVRTATRHIVPQQGTVGALRALGTIEIGDDCPASENANFLVDDGDAGQDSLIPAGITFFGQMIDHDLTLDVVSSLTHRADPAAITNVRNANLDMDFLYGGGPEATPHLYTATNTMLVIGDDIGNAQRDLYRTSSDKTVALIGDPRNDENLAVSQLQAALIAFHNKLVVETAFHVIEETLLAAFSHLDNVGRSSDEKSSGNRSLEVQDAMRVAEESVKSCTRREVDSLMGNEAVMNVLASSDVTQIIEKLREKCPGKASIGLLSPHEREETFETVRNHVTHFYHRVIREEFLPHIIGHDRVDEMVREGRRFFFPNGFQTDEGGISEPNLPVEFTAAAYRFGHSQVRETYDLNERASGIALLKASPGDTAGICPTLDEYNLYKSMDRDAQIKFAENTNKDFGHTSSMNGFSPICPQDRINWDYFFTSKSDGAGCGAVNCARKTDARLSRALFDLPFVNSEAAGKGESACRAPNPEESLAARNLNRGRVFRLPSGEDILAYLNNTGVPGAKHYCSGTRARDGGCVDLINLVEEKLAALEKDDPEAKRLAAIGQLLEKGDTPLWLYILIEAEFTEVYKDGDRIVRAQRMVEDIVTDDKGDVVQGAGGQVLGDVGGLIVGEVILGLLDHYREQTSAGLDFIPTLPDSITSKLVDGNGMVRMLKLTNYAYDQGSK